MATAPARNCNWLSSLWGIPLLNEHPALAMASRQAPRPINTTACAQGTKLFEVKPMQVSIVVLWLTARGTVLREACTITLFQGNPAGGCLGLPSHDTNVSDSHQKSLN